MTDAAPVPPPVSGSGTPRRRRWPKVLLITSLVLNAMLIGVVIRGLWTVRANVALGGGSMEAALPAFVATLPAERRDELRRSGAPERPGALRPLRVEVRRARADVARAFVADPFDKQAFIAAQQRLTEAESRFRAAVQQVLPELGERMTAAERRAYLHWRVHGWIGHRRGRGGDGEADQRDWREGGPSQR